MINKISKSTEHLVKALIEVNPNDNKNSELSLISKVEDYLDLNTSKINFYSMSKEDISKFGKIVNQLAKKGIVGNHYYEIDGKIIKKDITVSLGDVRLYGKEYHDFKPTISFLV